MMYKHLHINYRGGCNIAMGNAVREGLDKLFNDEKDIAIYGAWNAGRKVLDYLLECGDAYKVKCFLDRKAALKPEYFGLPVYNADDEHLDLNFRKNGIVIITVNKTPDQYVQITEHNRWTTLKPWVLKGYMSWGFVWGCTLKYLYLFLLSYAFPLLPCAISDVYSVITRYHRNKPLCT